jgi:carbon-monoxide dehydrogenase large subunit
VTATHASESAGRFVGQAVNRKEDPRLLTGRGTYVDDVQVPGLLHAAFVRSNVAHGRIVSIDTSAAGDVDGVVAVVTGAALNPGRGSMHPTIQLTDPNNTDVKPLAEDRVLFVGDPIAVVVAETRAIAEDAAELVEVDIDSLDAVVGFDAALADGAPLVHPEKGGNVGADTPVLIPGWDEIKAGAAHVVTATFHQHRQTNVPMETRGILASYDPASGDLRCWLSTQNPHEARAAIARCTGVPMHQIRVTARDVGGGFGQKMFLFRDEQTIAAVAVHVGRAVKWIEDRRENLIAANHARADRTTVELALDGDGRLLGAFVDETEDSGAWPLGAMGGAAGAVGAFFSGAYKLPFVSWHARSIWTNTCQRGAYRGPWMMETTAREEMIEYAARAIGIDPLELRRRNVIHRDELPYTTPMGMTYDETISPDGTLEQAASVIGYDEFRAEQRRAFDEEGRLLGIGLSLYIEPCAMGAMDPLGTETASVQVLPTGAVQVSIGTGSHGQGLETTFAQVVAEELGVEYDDVIVLQGDTETQPFGRGTGGSGSAIIGANACRLACAAVRDKAFAIAAHVMEAAPGDLEMATGRVQVKGTPARGVEFTEIARIAYLDTARLPDGMEPTLEATRTYKARPVTWSNACHACTVEVDRVTGLVRILRYVVSEDCGTMINPKIVDGQIAGGVVQGIGGVLLEHMVYDDDGNPLSTTFMDYLLPTAAEIPDIEIHHIETPAPNPGGHKGVGEGGAIGAPACVFNAVADALARLEIVITDQPLGPRQVLDALMAAGH